MRDNLVHCGRITGNSEVTHRLLASVAENEFAITNFKHQNDKPVTCVAGAARRKRSAKNRRRGGYPSAPPSVLDSNRKIALCYTV